MTPRSAAARVERLVRGNDVLVEISRRIGPALALEPVVRTVLDGMRQLIEFRGGSVGLVDGRGVYLAASDPEVSPEVRDARVPIGRGITGRVVDDGVSILVPDLDLDPRVDPALRRLGSNAGMVSYLAVPLVSLDKVIGVLQVDASRPGAFDDDDRLLLESLAAQVAGAIDSARAFERVAELEALKNRFTSRVTAELTTPLRVLESAFALLDAEPEPSRQVELLARSRAASAEVLALVESLLTLSRLETSPLSVTPKTVALAGVLEQVRRELGSPIAVGPAAGLEVRADPELLGRALLFAARSVAGGGAVRVEATIGPVVDVLGPTGADDLRLAVARSLLALQGGVLEAIPGGVRVDLTALAC